MVKKTHKDTCPKCGHRNQQIIQGPYPEYDKYTDTITKYFICDHCLTEYYEKYTLNYAGCEARELIEKHDWAGYQMVKYDANGNKII